MDIEKNILNVTDFEIMLYKNLSILQILLHELEHANQRKIAYTENSLEALIIRLSYLIEITEYKKAYEYCPEERLAEIKSYEEILLMINYIENKRANILNIFNTEKLQGLLHGYHYLGGNVKSPLYTFLSQTNQIDLYDCIDFDSNIELNEQMKYGFNITIDEYAISMQKLILNLNKHFRNRTNFK